MMAVSLLKESSLLSLTAVGSNDDRFGSKQGDNNSLGNANEILSNNGGIDIDLSLTLGK
jgi:hypothetical protein